MMATELEIAIQTLTANYLKWKRLTWVRNPLAWALYNTWLEVCERDTEPYINAQNDKEQEDQAP